LFITNPAKEGSVDKSTETQVEYTLTNDATLMYNFTYHGVKLLISQSSILYEMILRGLNKW